MEDMELAGVVRGKRGRTTIPAEVGARPADLVERNFTAAAPNALLVAGLNVRQHLERLLLRGLRDRCLQPHDVGGGSLARYTLNWHWMRSRWRSGHGAARISLV